MNDTINISVGGGGACSEASKTHLVVATPIVSGFQEGDVWYTVKMCNYNNKPGMGGI